MKKLTTSKLTFHREVLRSLSSGELALAQGGAKAPPEPKGSGLLSFCPDRPCPNPPPTPSVKSPAVAYPCLPDPTPMTIVVV